MRSVQNFNDAEFLVRTGVCKDLEAAEAYIANQTVVGEIVPIKEKIKFEQTRHDRGYSVAPRHQYVFIRPAPPKHPVREIFPQGESSDQDVGWIHASIVDGLPPGTLVSYDKFSAIAGGMNVVDDSGEEVYVAMIDEAAVSAVLSEKEVVK